MSNDFIDMLLEREARRDKELLRLQNRVAELTAPLTITTRRHASPTIAGCTRVTVEWRGLKYATLVMPEVADDEKYMEYVERSAIRHLLEGHVDDLLSKSVRIELTGSDA